MRNLRKNENRLFPVSITALIAVILLAFPFHGFASLSSSEAEEARLALERLGRVYVSTNDILKLANEIDPSTKLPYADTLSFFILASKAQRHLESQDYGKLFGESTWFVGKKAIGKAYPFAAPFLVLGEFYYGLFKKITGIPQHFENQFFRFQMNKYLSLREAYDAKSVREFALDSPLGLADDRAKGYFFSSGMGGSTSTQVNLALRLRDSGITPETIFELGERVWDIQQKLSSLPNDGSVRELVQRLKQGTQSATTGLTSRAQQNVVQTSEATDYLLVPKIGARWVYTVTQEFQTTTSRSGQQYKVTKQESGTLTIINEGEKDFEGLNAFLFVSHYQFKFGSYSRNSYYHTSPEGIMLVGSEFIQPTKPPRRTKHDPPLLYIKNPLVTGTTWRTEKSTKTVIGQERVKVPAGEFDAVKLVTEGVSGTTTTEWWVKGVGLVKRFQAKPRMGAELLNYSIPDAGSVLAKRQTGQKDQTEGRGKAKDQPQTAVAASDAPPAAPYGVTFKMLHCEKSYAYRSIRVEAPASMDLSDDATARDLLVRGAHWGEEKCHWGHWGNIDVYVFQNPKGQWDYVVHGRNYDKSDFSWREYHNKALQKRLQAEAAKRQAEEQARREAEWRAQQARIAKEVADREAARQRRWNEFVSKYGVQEMVDARGLHVNPFLYQGKTVAIQTYFERMTSPDVGVFGDGHIVVSGLPRDLFRQRSVVVLVGRVIGTTELKTRERGEPAQAAHLKFLGVHLCKDYSCTDLLAQR